MREKYCNNCERVLENMQALKAENELLKAKNSVLRDSGLRTYDGMAQKADKYDELKGRCDRLVEAASRFAKIEADCGDNFEGVHGDVILRVEITAGDLHAIREALKSFFEGE